MKTLNLTLIIAAIFLLASCQKKSDLATELTSADEIATEGMEEAEHEAEEHNEELAECADSNNCTVAAIQEADSLFHYQSDMFDFHHDSYSHNNLDDDHHHSAVSSHSHGDAVHGEEEEGADHGHSIEGHQEMEEIRAEHEQYHPN
jgi:hypothetical protein